MATVRWKKPPKLIGGKRFPLTREGEYWVPKGWDLPDYQRFVRNARSLRAGGPGGRAAPRLQPGEIGPWRTPPNLGEDANRYLPPYQRSGWWVTKPRPEPGPYDQFPEFAQQFLRQMDRDRDFHTEYAKQVQQQLSQALAGIQQYNTQAQTNFQQAVSSIPQPTGGMPVVTGASGSGIYSSPQNYLTQAAIGQGAQETTTGREQAAIQALLRNTGMGNMRAGLEAALSREMLAIPEMYKKEKYQYITRLEEFMAQQAAGEARLAEERRQFDIEQARLSANDYYDLIGMLTSAGVNLAKARMPEPFRGSGGVLVRSARPPRNPNYEWYEEQPGVWRGIPVGSSGGTGPGGMPRVRGEGLVGPFMRASDVPRGYDPVRLADGMIYGVKRQGGGGGGGPGGGGSGGLSPEQRRLLFKEARTIWFGEESTDRFGRPVTREALKDRGKLQGGGITDEQRFRNIASLYNQVRGMGASVPVAASIVRNIIGNTTYNRWWNTWVPRNRDKVN